MKDTKIQWCDSTWNPWRGCTKVNAGCAHCYAEGWGKRFGVEWGKGKPRKLASEAYWKQPLAWNRKPWFAACCNRWWGERAERVNCCPECSTESEHEFIRRRRVFCGSLMDWLDDEVPIEWLARLLDTIRLTPNLQWMLLSKRCDLWKERIAAAKRTGRREDFLGHGQEGEADGGGHCTAYDWLVDGHPPANVIVGTSVCGQATADEAIPHLLRIPAAKRFVSYEPAIEPVDFSKWITEGASESDGERSRIHQIIIGGESGPNARPCNIEWIRSTIKQCREAGVKCFVKQLGANPIMEPGPLTYPCEDHKGANMSEWPEDLKVRETI